MRNLREKGIIGFGGLEHSAWVVKRHAAREASDEGFVVARPTVELLLRLGFRSKHWSDQP